MNLYLNLNLWHDIMYCVGVFVTCNIGGAALRLAHNGVSAMMKRHAVTADASDKGDNSDGRKRHPFDKLPFDEKARYSDIENAAAEQNAASEWNSQSFDDIQREIGRTDDTQKPDKGADA